MSRTTRFDNGLNKGRDDKPFDARCEPRRNAKGYDSFLDDHGHYGAGGHRVMKRLATRARRNFEKAVARLETEQVLLIDVYDEELFPNG